MRGGGMTIGGLAKAAGVNVETIRYYQRRGLIEEPTRPPGGQRRYADSVIKRLAFIRGAQRLGFSLEEVKSLLQLAHGTRPADTREIAERKYAELGRRTQQLDGMRRKLKQLIAKSLKAKPTGPCPIILALSAPE